METSNLARELPRQPDDERVGDDHAAPRLQAVTGSASSGANTPLRAVRSRLLVRLLRYTWERRLSLREVAWLTLLYVAGITAGGLTMGPMFDAGQIMAYAQTPDWTKLFTSYLGFLIFFQHLRALLDARDVERDRVEHPNRPAARGLVSPGELMLLALVMFGIELLLLANVGALRLSAWILAAAFSFALRVDFGARGFVSRRPWLQVAAHSLAYPLVLAMLVAVAWEARITFGIVPGYDMLTGRYYDGIQSPDLFTMQPLLTGLLYAGGFMYALAADIAAERSRLGRPRLVRALGMVLPVAAAGLLATMSWLLLPSTGSAAATIAAIVAGTAVALVLRRRWSPVWIASTVAFLAITASGQLYMRWI